MLATQRRNSVVHNVLITPNETELIHRRRERVFLNSQQSSQLSTFVVHRLAVSSIEWLGVLLLINHGVSLKLNQPIRIDKPRYLHDCVRGSNLPKELTVNFSDGLPILDAHKKCASDWLDAALELRARRRRRLTLRGRGYAWRR